MIVITKRYNAIFLLLLLLHLLCITLQMELAVDITKPSLLIFLIFFFNRITKNFNGANRWVMPALVCSLTGDVLLIFQTYNDLFFIFGLGAFLVAHIFYILYFLFSGGENRKFQLKVIPSFLVLMYTGILFGFLYPKLGDLKIPVLVYTLTIATMLLSVIHVFKHCTTPAKLCLTGAALFVLSDSVLAINKFHTAFYGASQIIMLTYGLAQLFLVNGILRNQP